MIENQVTEYKSLRKAETKDGLRDLAKACVGLANAQGGLLIIGIEDQESEPPEGQTISLPQAHHILEILRGNADHVAIVNPQIKDHANGAQSLELNVLPSLNSVATTSDGRIYIRVADKCLPANSEDLVRLVSEKNAFQWELVTPGNISLREISTEVIQRLVERLRASSKVSAFVKGQSNEEVLEYFRLVHQGKVTHLGLLWLGNPSQRALITYPLTLQYLVYDDRGNKIRKAEWRFLDRDPMDMILEVEREAVELRYSYEMPQGMFRKQIPNFAPEVIRELLVNAVAHRAYTLSGDVFLEVHPDRLEISNPGGLPLGITESNILHQRQRRNPHLITLLSSLGLMEGEGSGYDLIYQSLVRDAKPFPEILTDFNRTTVILQSRILDPEAIRLCEYLDSHYQLTQRELLVCGLLARERKMLGLDLSRTLQLEREERLRSYVGRLLERSILVTRGIKKGTEYLLNPLIYGAAKINIKASLKTMEPAALMALIQEDLKVHPDSRISDIRSRLPDLDLKDIRKAVYRLKTEGVLAAEGPDRSRVYRLAKKK